MTAKPYSFDQNDTELHVLLPLAAAYKAKDVVFSLSPNSLTLGIKGQPPVIDEALWGTVKRDDSLWEVDTRGGERVVVVTLAKATPATWDFLLKSEVRPLRSQHVDARVCPGPAAGSSGTPCVSVAFRWCSVLRRRAQDVPPDTTPTSKVFFDVTVGGEPAGRVVMALFGNVAPRTAENFRQLCSGESGNTASGVPRHFKGCKFHRIIPGFMVQGACNAVCSMCHAPAHEAGAACALRLLTICSPSRRR